MRSVKIDPFPTIHDNCRLLSSAYVYFSSPFCKPYGPRFHSVCFHGKSILGVHLDIYMSRQHFLDTKKLAGKGLNVSNFRTFDYHARRFKTIKVS